MSFQLYLQGVTLAELKKLQLPKDLEGDAREQAKVAKRTAVSIANSGHAGKQRFDVAIDCRDPSPEGATVPPPAAITVSVARNLTD